LYNFSIKDAKQIDLIEYLNKLWHKPSKIRNNDYWYLSPLRDEQTASFKVNKSLNCWFDFGLGEGGSIIDFGIKYFNCSVKEFWIN
jgi:DNA primase